MGSNTLDFVTLKQGKIYKDLQQKILDGSLERHKKRKEKRGKGREGKEGMQSNTESEQTSQLLRYTQLQKQFNELMSQYKILQAQLISKTSNNLSISRGKNVYVNSVISNPTAMYLGPYKESSSMTTLDNGARKYNYSSCMQAALTSNNSIFGLENLNAATQLAQCNVSSNADSARKNGLATNGCSSGSDGKQYGQFQSNTTAIYNTADSTYKGCFYNSSTTSNLGPNMEMSGISMDRYSSVYVLGSYGMGPWGNSGKFPDATAKWIWYSPNAQSGAPINNNAPITFIYEYNHTGTTYITAKVSAIIDDSGAWYLNSNKVGTISGGWGGPAPTFNITLAPGINYLQCSAINTGGPAGLVATVMYNGRVLFNTNSSWKYTNDPVSSMIVNGTNYSVKTCQDYAKKNNYQYFGLKNGTTGSSQCVVSNSFKTATEYGSSDPIKTLSDGYMYGIGAVNSLYRINNEGANPAFIGKIGYVDRFSQVKEYPSSMIQSSNSIPKIIQQDSSCPQAVEAIDSITWGKLKKNGIMTPNTKCGLAEVIQESQERVKIIKGELGKLADEILSVVAVLKQNNQNINEQLNMNEATFSENIAMYQDISNQFHQYKGALNNNSSFIVADSKQVFQYENYQYIFWGVLALSIIIITLHTMNR
uniref:Uncharacterized protein n=1 Tax=viral metagenome TaxID=1070528 RepID=A0A6C0LGL3_9ZZZZ